MRSPLTLPFSWPPACPLPPAAEFTFVVRSFTVLDGIGKSLDPRFDISEISAPYARELLLESRPAMARYQERVATGLVQNNRAFKNLFTGPNQIEDVRDFTKRLENGDLKLRVRALEAERALSRVQLMQEATVQGLLASMFVNVGTVLSVSALQAGATACFGAAGLLGVMALARLLKVQGLQKKERQITGAA